MRPIIKGSSILVTGGAGFIGSHLVDRLLQEEAREVVIIDNMFLGSEDNLAEALAGNVTLYKDNAEEFSALAYIFKKHDIDIVFNCATKALNYSFVNPRNAFDANVKIILNLLELQREKHFATLCHFSTSEVYGTAVYEPMDEKHPLAPTTTYAAGKAAADLALESYVRMYDLDAFIVRPFNNYGPRQNYKGYLAGVIPITVWRIMNEISPEIHGDGNQTRDFIYVGDTVDAVMKSFSELSPCESVNISSDGQISIKSVIEKVCVSMVYSGEIIYKPARDADVDCHNASNEKIKRMISYSLTSFEQGLETTIEWYKNFLKVNI